MTRPDDSLLDPDQLANVQRHADRLLQEASATGRFPTPIDDLMAAASDPLILAALRERLVRLLATSTGSSRPLTNL